MLSLVRVSAQMAIRYYKEDNYYTKTEGIQESQWIGNGSLALGLTGNVTHQDFKRLLEGNFPIDPIEKIGPKIDPKTSLETEKLKTHRAGTHLTFSAPKTVSLALLVGGDNRIEVAHRDAVAQTLKYVESEFLVTRIGGKNDRKQEKTNSAVIAMFHHDTSRKHDPQLHTHCVVLNGTKRQDGHWRSVHNDPFFENSKLIGLIYQNALAIEIQKLGYGIERKKEGTFEIAGYKREEVLAFSKRSQEIRALFARSKKKNERKN